MEQVEMINTNELEECLFSSSEKFRMAWDFILEEIEDNDGPLEKKLKTETNDKTEGQVEVEKLFDDLPPEMVMKILKNLNDADLFSYRLVNRQWNGVASEILQTNASVELRFVCSNVMHILGKNKNKMSFKNLIEYFENSPNFPYSRLRFDKVQKPFFAKQNWTQLVTNHGDRIKCLILGMQGISEEDIIQVSKDLRKLLFDQLPNLQQFGIEFSPTNTPSKIQFFPTTTTSNSKKVRLPHLKVLYLDDSSLTLQSEFVTDIFDAAVNLRRIELFGRTSGFLAPIQDFHFLHSFGKLDLLQSASIRLNGSLLSTVKEKCTTFPSFKLKELELHYCIFLPKDRWPEATVFISNLFESCKDTLTKLNMPPSGFLPELQLPSFSKLNNLTINNDKYQKFLPNGLNLTEIFPVLNSLELKVCWATAFSNFNSLDSLPVLETLEVSSGLVNSNSVAQINSMCPNLKNLKNHQTNYSNQEVEYFSEVTKAIWTHLTKLHSLEFHINVDCSNIDDQALDSCITGMSKKECKRLYQLNIADQALKLAGCQWKIPDSEWKYEQENVSILNLEDLKSFTVGLISRSPNKSKLDLVMTSVSEKYALKLMDNLTYNIKRE